MKTLQLNKIKSSGNAKKTKEYPILPDAEGNISLLVRDIINEDEQLKALETSVRAKKAVRIAS